MKKINLKKMMAITAIVGAFVVTNVASAFAITTSNHAVYNSIYNVSITGTYSTEPAPTVYEAVSTMSGTGTIAGVSSDVMPGYVNVKLQFYKSVKGVESLTDYYTDKVVKQGRHSYKYSIKYRRDQMGILGGRAYAFVGLRANYNSLTCATYTIAK